MRKLLIAVVLIMGLPLLAFALFWSWMFIPAKLLEGEQATQIAAFRFEGGTLHVLQHAHELIISTYVRVELSNEKSHTFIIDGDARRRWSAGLREDKLSSEVLVSFDDRAVGRYLIKRGLYRKIGSYGAEYEFTPWEAVAIDDHPIPRAITHFRRPY